MFNIQTKFLAVFAVASFALAACDNNTEEMEVDVAAQAQELAQSAIIVDTHIDVPYRVIESQEDVTQATEDGDFDYPRAKAGGLNGAFMSVYIPAAMETEGTAKAHADALIDLVEDIATRAPEKFAVAKSVADVRSQFEAGLISLPMGMENGAPINGDLNNLQHFYDRGIRYITLTHSLSNHIADSSYDENRQWGGLSPFGKELIVAMNNVGVMVDVSHVSDAAFWDVMEISKVPVIASHSSARHFTPGFERNMSDEMILALAENGGVIQINWGSSFLTERANGFRNTVRELYLASLEASGEEDTPERAQAFGAAYVAENGYPYASLNDVLDHFDHVVGLVGIDYVGIGSDYDGVGDSLPTDLKDVSQYPNLIEGLLRRGYSEQDVRKILGENILRVWEAVEAYAGAASEGA